MRWSYLPPLMVYFAAGISGFTGIIESFFVKETLGLSAGFLAGLGFWTGLPWALKMPLGHLVDWLATVLSYATIYWISLSIPLISILGVLLASWMRIARRRRLLPANLASESSQPMTGLQEQASEPNWYILVGSALFVIAGLILGLSDIPVKQEAIFLGSMGIIALLMGQILRDLSPAKRREIISLAVIIFVFRAMPTAGAGVS